MGASLSSLAEGANGSAIGPSLGDIPESCVACVFLYLTPPEICNLARLNRAFRGAASSDSVWEKKLPSNYQDLLHLIPPERYQNLSKKDIFALLSRPVPIDDGNKDFGLVGSRRIGNFDLRLSSCFVPLFENEEMGDKLSNAETGVQEVWLDRVTGRVCMAVSAKGMAITGIDDRRYWNWIPTEESRFHVVAYLQQIWWFEVDGVVKFPFPADVYTVTLRLHLGRFSKRLGRRVSSFEHTHGWDIKPVRFELSADGLQTLSECSLDDTEEDNINGNHKRGCWIEYKLGEFVVSESEPAPEVRFSMKQIDCTHSKGGLCVDSVFIFPSNLRELRRKGDLK